MRRCTRPPADLAALQELLDRSYEPPGAHLLRIHTPERRLTAEQVAERLTGHAPARAGDRHRRRTADRRPGGRDLLRGAFHFGSAPDSVRFRHIGARPQVSATHLPGEELAVTVHGRAVPVDIRAEEGAELRQTLLDIYVPRYGPEWEEEFLDSGPVYARIDAERMFTFHMVSGVAQDARACSSTLSLGPRRRAACCRPGRGRRTSAAPGRPCA